MQFIYFDLAYAVGIHDKILSISGGNPGAINLGRLDAILHHVQNDDYYCSFEDKLSYLVFAVNKGHCFTDANKRTSIALGAFFLEINGLDILVNKFIIEMENIAVYVADNIIGRDLTT